MFTREVKFVIAGVFAGLISGFILGLGTGMSYMSYFSEKTSLSRNLVHLVEPNDDVKNELIEVEEVEYMAWLPYWDYEEGIESLMDAKEFLSVVSPAWYRLNENVTLERIDSPPQEEVTRIASESGMLLMPLVGNDLDGERAIRFFGDIGFQEEAIEFLMAEAVENGYEGYDLDFESFPQDYAQEYVSFLRNLKNKMHEHDLKLSVAVHARTGRVTDWEMAKGHDYQGIAEVADQVRIMAYDFHHIESEPGPTTPESKLIEVIEYAQTTIPDDKLVLGLPTYGYDWWEEEGEGITYTQAEERLESFNGNRQRSSDLDTLTGEYLSQGVSHVLWYEDTESILRKVELAKSLGVKKFVFWKLGGEDLRIWEILSELSR